MIKNDSLTEPLNTIIPAPFPAAWAQCYGHDQYGLWQGVYVEDIEVRFRWIPPGRFEMGSLETEAERSAYEGPRHPVTFTKGFWLAETTCSQALWLSVMDTNPSRISQIPDSPVENVNWHDAQDFIQVLNRMFPEIGVRLPSEAEWEYACRAGGNSPFWWGETLSTDQANYDGNYPYAECSEGEVRNSSVPVKHFSPNPWGLYQMHGNVWEWCEDEWHEDYRSAPRDGKPWVKAGDSKQGVMRGGSWGSYGGDLRSACRNHNWRAYSSASIGFRIARDSDEEGLRRNVESV